MSFEVAWRILQSTPVNATGLVSALLLTTHGVALTLGQLHHTLQDSLDYLERKQTPMSTSALRLRTPEGSRSPWTRCPTVTQSPASTVAENPCGASPPKTSTPRRSTATR